MTWAHNIPLTFCFNACIDFSILANLDTLLFWLFWTQHEWSFGCVTHPLLHWMELTCIVESTTNSSFNNRYLLNHTGIYFFYESELQRNQSTTACLSHLMLTGGLIGIVFVFQVAWASRIIFTCVFSSSRGYCQNNFIGFIYVLLLQLCCFMDRKIIILFTCRSTSDLAMKVSQLHDLPFHKVEHLVGVNSRVYCSQALVGAWLVQSEWFCGKELHQQWWWWCRTWWHQGKRRKQEELQWQNSRMTIR